MTRFDISRILGEAADLADMLDHAAGMGNVGLVTNLAAQIRRHLSVANVFITEAIENNRTVPVGFDLVSLSARYQDIQKRLDKK